MGARRERRRASERGGRARLNVTGSDEARERWRDHQWRSGTWGLTSKTQRVGLKVGRHMLLASLTTNP